MLSEHEQDSHHHSATHLDGASHDLVEHDNDSTDSPDGALHGLQTLMSSAGLSAHRNAPVRANIIHGMQQTHGNAATARAVQRHVQRSAANAAHPLPVQREEDEEITTPRINPLPIPKLELPFGGGLFGSVDPVEASMMYKRGEGEYKLGYEYGGTLTGEAKHGPWWAKGKYNKDGYAVGLGRGGPILNKPGLPPMINDPRGDLLEHKSDPATIGKSVEEIGEASKGPGFGVEVGKDKDRGTYVVGGVKGTFGKGAKKRPKPPEHISHEPNVPERMTREQLQKHIDEYKAQEHLRKLFLPGILSEPGIED